MSNTINGGKIQGLSYSPETNLTGTAAAPSFSNTKSIDLDGVDDFVQVSNDTDINFTSAFSVSMWFNTSSSNVMYAITHGSGSEIKYYIQLYAPIDRILLFLADGSSANIALSNTQVFDDGQWHHLAFTTDGTTTADKVIVYFDGSPLTNKATLLNTGIRSVTTDLFIGKIPNTGRFVGNMDEIALFNSELSQSDITAIYNSGVPTSLSSYSSLVSWWRCGDGDTSPTLTDNGSGGNNGTMTNFTTFSTDVPT